MTADETHTLTFFTQLQRWSGRGRGIGWKDKSKWREEERDGEIETEKERGTVGGRDKATDGWGKYSTQDNITICFLLGANKVKQKETVTIL